MKILPCKVCKTPIELPEAYEFDLNGVYCRDHYIQTFGEAQADFAENSAEEKEAGEEL